MGRYRTRRKQVARVVALATVGTSGAAMVFVTVTARLSPVLERGSLIPEAPGYYVERVSWFGIDFLVDVSLGRKDVVTAALLFALAALAAAAAFRLRRYDDGRAQSFQLIAAAAGFLAADEALAVHETVGHNLGRLVEPPLVNHPDDAIFLAYGVLAVLIAWDVRELLRGATFAMWVLAAAGATAAVGMLVDAGFLVSDLSEEVLEVASAALGIAGVAALVKAHLRRNPAMSTETLSPTEAAPQVAEPVTRIGQREQRHDAGPTRHYT